MIFHVDMDCFFVSVGIRDRPHLRDMPVGVSHSKGAMEAASAEIGRWPRGKVSLRLLEHRSLIQVMGQGWWLRCATASCNYIARQFGVSNGMMCVAPSCVNHWGLCELKREGAYHSVHSRHALT